MRSIQKTSFIVLSLLVVAAMLVGCATPTPQVIEKIVEQTVVVEKSVEKVITATPVPAKVIDTFVFGAQGEPVCLDPAIVTDGISGRVINQVFEGLVKFDGATTNVVPSLAESWTTSDDGKTWTFKLRKGVKFHDGADFTADAVVKNFDYWKNTKNVTHAAQIAAGQTFEYYEAQFGGFDGDSAITAIEAVDATTVKFTLKDPMGPFLNNLAMFVFTLWSPAALEKAGVNSCKTPVGTGPYKFVEWKANEQVSLTAFADYWDKPNAAKMKNVVIRNIPNNSARLLALSAGEIHGMEGMEPRDVAAVKTNPKFKLLLRPANTTGYVAFNFKVKEFTDPKVRQAFATAINKQAVVDAFYGGTGQPAKEFQPPALWGFNDKITDRKFDADAAKKLLADAGYPNGISEVTFDGKKVPLEFWYMPVSRPYYPNPKDIATAIAADWAKAGIKVTLQTVDWATYLDKRKNGLLPLYMLGWTGDNGDPDNFTCYFLCLDSKNSPKVTEGFWQETAVSDVLKKAAILTKQADRVPLYQQAEQMLFDGALRIFIANNQPPLAFVAGVSGYVPNPTGTELFNTVVVK